MTTIQRPRVRHTSFLLLSSGVLAAWLSACAGGTSGDNEGETGSGTGGQGGSSVGGSGGTSPGGTGTLGQPVAFTVPEGGGVVEVSTGSEAVFEFEFPPSAAGLALELTPSGAAAVGWPEGQFSSVIELLPDGTTFEEPVVVRPANDTDLLLHFSGHESSAALEVLQPNAAGDGLELWHFSQVASLPGALCNEISIYDTSHPLPNCLELTHGTAAFACRSPDNCLEVVVSCCTSSIPAQCGFRGSREVRSTVVRNDRNRDSEGRCGGSSGGTGGAGGTSGVSGGAGVPDTGAGGSSGAGGTDRGGSGGASGASGSGMTPAGGTGDPGGGGSDGGGTPTPPDVDPEGGSGGTGGGGSSGSSGSAGSDAGQGGGMGDPGA